MTIKLGCVLLTLCILISENCRSVFADNQVRSPDRSTNIRNTSLVQPNVALPQTKIKTQKISRRQHGEVTGSHNDQPVTISWEPNGLTIQAKLASIPQILKAIAIQSGIVIHYSALPDGHISINCEGKLFSQVLECLIGSKVNVAYRYPNQINDKSNNLALTHKQPEEIWVLGIDRADGHYATMACTLDNKASKTYEAAKAETPDSHNMLLQIADLNDTQYGDLRKQAISLLAAQGKTGDPEKDDATIEALQKAFHDKDTEVKAQAVFGMSNQDVPESTQILEEAITDNNPDVRLMAVDSANADNPANRASLNRLCKIVTKLSKRQPAISWALSILSRGNNPVIQI